MDRNYVDDTVPIEMRWFLRVISILEWDFSLDDFGQGICPVITIYKDDVE